MKKIISLLFFTPFSATIAAGDVIPPEQLPGKAQTFISTHFHGDKIFKAEVDDHWQGRKYEVELKSGAELEFFSDGSWKEVSAARGCAVPPAIVPKGIYNYVCRNFSQLYIAEIQRKHGIYEVELSNGTELLLYENGQHMTNRY